jgi:putative membrane protein
MPVRLLAFSAWSLSRMVASRLTVFVVEIGVYSLGVALLDHYLLGDKLDIHPNFHALLGTVLGLLLVFRTNTAYDRWWEGRKLWGQLVNDSRNLAIKVKSLERIAAAEAHQFGRLLVNFARALKEHLREGIRPKQLSVYRNVPVEPRHVPAHVALMIRDRVRDWKRHGQIDGYDELILDVHVRALMDICGACERIRKTPITRSYLAFLHQSILIYLVTLPWGVVDLFGWWTVPLTAIITYFMIGIELVAEEVEEPFGRTEDDLLLDDICQGIEASVMEILSGSPRLGKDAVSRMELGGEPVPEPVEPELGSSP